MTALPPVRSQKSLYSHALGVAALILGLLLTSAEAATSLQANQYSEIEFKVLGHKAEEFVFTVPVNSVATLRVTELGCPGDRFLVTSGRRVLFGTSSVPSRIFCRKPYSIASASVAFGDPFYSKGSIKLGAGNYRVRVTPFSKTSRHAAIGFFIKGSNPPATSTTCTVPVVTETEVIALTSTVVLFTDEAPSATAVSSKSATQAVATPSTSARRHPPWMTRGWFPQHTAKLIAATVEDNYDVVTVTAEAPTNIVTVSEGCETTTATSMLPSYTTEIESSTTNAETTATTAVETTLSESESITSEIETTTIAPETTTSSAPESTTEPGTATATASEVTTFSEPEPTSVQTTTVEPWTSTTETATVETTMTSEVESTTSEISSTASLEPETSTAVASETSAVETPSTSAQVTETTASEVPTSTDVTTSSAPTTAEPTETASPTTTDEATSTSSVPTPIATCTGQSRYLRIVTDPSYLFKDAEEACGVNYRMARISTFKEIKDASNVLLACGIERAWIKVESANTIDRPKCFAINQDRIYEPNNCEQDVMQVLCATP